ncbi:uncharacterized protein BXZ73DRAFT_100644 [Epithele typhae]|uniref:uncharacterized protein n=1 Tax=Epithele typhae TaxID=378194 RepID=UPI00200894EF|nr:uncharacterized protein BXZ73DRAFT_100644 [Epithele typhae]KAH9934453.1 hypothetical protein BXZ73DRAFT_100644 [Epithele typhae]
MAFGFGGGGFCRFSPFCQDDSSTTSTTTETQAQQQTITSEQSSQNTVVQTMVITSVNDLTSTASTTVITTLQTLKPTSPSTPSQPPSEKTGSSTGIVSATSAADHASSTTSGGAVITFTETGAGATVTLNNQSVPSGAPNGAATDSAAHSGMNSGEIAALCVATVAVLILSIIIYLAWRRRTRHGLESALSHSRTSPTSAFSRYHVGLIGSSCNKASPASSNLQTRSTDILQTPHVYGMLPEYVVHQDIGAMNVDLEAGRARARSATTLLAPSAESKPLDSLSVCSPAAGPDGSHEHEQRVTPCNEKAALHPDWFSSTASESTHASTAHDDTVSPSPRSSTFLLRNGSLLSSAPTVRSPPASYLAGAPSTESTLMFSPISISGFSSYPASTVTTSPTALSSAPLPRAADVAPQIPSRAAFALASLAFSPASPLTPSHASARSAVPFHALFSSSSLSPPLAPTASSLPPLPEHPATHAHPFPSPAFPSPSPSGSPLAPPPTSPYAWDRPPPSSEYLPGWSSRRATLRSVRSTGTRSSAGYPSPPYAVGDQDFDLAALAAAVGARRWDAERDARSERSALPAYSQY